MGIATARGGHDAVVAVAIGGSPALALDPTRLLEAPGPVRAVAVFLGVLLAGGALLRRFEPFVERAIDASTARPLRSMAYGLAAHLVVAFAAVYLASQLAGFSVSGRSVGGVGAVLGVGLLLLAGAVGFTVAGQIATGLRGRRRPMVGLVVGALGAAAVALVDPLVGGLVWLVVVSTGIGGPVRSWVHASAEHDV